MPFGDTELTSTPAPNPKRVAAGRSNQRKRKGLTLAGRERLRQSALCHQPWTHSTGPRTAAGKAQAVANGKRRQLGPFSIRELRAALGPLRGLSEATAVSPGERLR